MPQVDPEHNEEGEVRDNDGRRYVIQRFRSLSQILSYRHRKAEAIVSLTARKKSLMSWVIYTASPMYVK